MNRRQLLKGLFAAPVVMALPKIGAASVVAAEMPAVVAVPALSAIVTQDSIAKLLQEGISAIFNLQMQEWEKDHQYE